MYMALFTLYLEKKLELRPEFNSTTKLEYLAEFLKSVAAQHDLNFYNTVIKYYNKLAF